MSQKCFYHISLCLFQPCYFLSHSLQLNGKGVISNDPCPKDCSPLVYSTALQFSDNELRWQYQHIISPTGYKNNWQHPCGMQIQIFTNNSSSHCFTKWAYMGVMIIHTGLLTTRPKWSSLLTKISCVHHILSMHTYSQTDILMKLKFNSQFLLYKQTINSVHCLFT